MINEDTLLFRFTSIDVSGQPHCIAVDPFRVDRLMAGALGGESIQHVVEVSRCGVPQLAEPAVEKILAAVEKCFGLFSVKPDGTGFNERAQFRVLAEYLRYRAEVKKNIAPPPISSDATEPAPSPSQPKSATPCGC